MKKYLFVPLVLLMVIGMLFASCAPQAAPAQEEPAEEAAPEEPAASGEKLKVALVHYGVFTDKSWGQGAYEGFMKAVEEYDLEYATTEMLPQGEWEAAFRDFRKTRLSIFI